MLKSLVLGSSLVAAVIVGVALGEEFKSGLQTGDFAGPFNIRNVTGQSCAVDYAKDDRDSFCYR